MVSLWRSHPAAGHDYERRCPPLPLGVGANSASSSLLPCEGRRVFSSTTGHGASPQAEWRPPTCARCSHTKDRDSRRAFKGKLERLPLENRKQIAYFNFAQAVAMLRAACFCLFASGLAG